MPVMINIKKPKTCRKCFISYEDEKDFLRCGRTGGLVNCLEETPNWCPLAEIILAAEVSGTEYYRKRRNDGA